jgi:hypothetical protein
MSDRAAENSPTVSAEQHIYARALGVGVKLAIGLLAAGFAAYVSGYLPSAVPLERLPELWGLPLAEYLQRTGMPRGWAWTGMLGHGDALALASIAFLLGVSTWCLFLLLPFYARRRDWTFFAVTLAEIAVLAVAASGVLTVVR